MSGIRIYELSRELNVQNKVLIDLLAGMGYPVKSHSSSIDFHLADRLRRQVKLQGLERKTPKKAAKPKAKPAAPKKEAKPAPEEKVETEIQISKQTVPAPEPEVEKQLPAATSQEIPAPAPPREPKTEAKPPETRRPSPRPARPLDQRPDREQKSRPGEKPRQAAPAPQRKESARPQADRKFMPRPAGKDDSPASKIPDTKQKPFTRPGPVKKKGKKDEREGSRWKKDDGKHRRDGSRPGGPKDKGKRREKRRPLTEEEQLKKIQEAEERELQRLIDEEERVKQEAEAKKVVIDEATTVKEFAEKARLSVNEIISKLMGRGIMATLNQTIDVDMAREMALELGLELKTVEEEQESAVEEEEDKARLKPRFPVVTIMGHVDHGKTSLLDTIRKTRVTEEEVGGITQRVGAYMVDVHGKGKVVFLDTPGHEAFTALRARGASVTDIVILVVAADDGVMPQTLEAIHHAEAAKVPVVVAVNKMDKPGANPDRIKQDLSGHGLVAEEWGGQTIFCEVSAKQGVGIDHLLEMVLLQAEVLELRADPDRMASGAIIESKLDKGRGPVATVLVQKGTLKVGDCFVAGANYGKVRALVDDVGKRRDEAGPCTPVEVLGFNGVPEAGEKLTVVESERKAHQISMKRLEARRLQGLASKGHVKLETLHAQITKGEMRDLNLIIKADLQGSIEAMRKALGDTTLENIRINILHSAVGGISETDINLASASNAIVIGFNVRPAEQAKALAEAEDVDVRLYSIIYNVIDDIKKALEGMLEPVFKEVVTGRAEIRQVYNISGLGTIAGCYVNSGKITRNSDARLIRDSVVVHTGKLNSLKRFKDDAKEVLTGYECGIGLERYNDIKLQDIIETFETQEVERKKEQ